MAAMVQASLVSAVLRHLPGPLLRALDAWSHRIARRRRAQRQQKWQVRKAGAAAPAPEIAYHLKPWRD